MRRADPPVAELVAQVRQRLPRAVARAVSQLENDPAAQRALIAAIYPHTGRARVVGITGPPGAGKSTLVDRLARACRARGETVGILAVDPTSPFSGGALLGDRVRMNALQTDPGVFIRSLATRGTMGGLSRATHDAINLLDAAGFDWVLVETVGVGQDEIDVVKSVETVVVVTLPGLGDEIQAIKAGIMEIADVFVINKSDRDGAEKTVRDLESMLAMGDHDATTWIPPILKTVASAGRGIDEVLAAVLRHREHLAVSGELDRRRLAHLRLRVETILEERVLRAADEILGIGREVEHGYSERVDPYAVADRLFAGVVAAPPAEHPVELAVGEPAGVRKIAHLGIAVRSIDEARPFYEALGLSVEAIEEVPQERVRVAMLAIGDSHLELLEPTGPESPIAKFLEKRGPGIHHLCVDTADVVAADRALRAAGYELLRPAPTLGAGGCLVQFVHPRSTGGVLLELSQPPAAE